MTDILIVYGPPYWTIGAAILVGYLAPKLTRYLWRRP